MEKLSFEGFTEVIKRTLPVYLGDEYKEYSVCERSVYKINEHLHAITVEPNAKGKACATPNIYLDDHFLDYKNGKEICEIVDEISTSIKSLPQPDKDMTMQQIEENVLDYIQAIVINADINEEYLKILPHTRFLDLAIVYRVIKSTGKNSSMGMMITYDILKAWKTDEKTIRNKAFKNNTNNTPPIAFHAGGMIAVSNTAGIYGAINGLIYKDVLRDAAQKNNGNIYIIPSSIHEVFIVPEWFANVGLLKETGKKILETGMLSPSDFLSSNVYMYDRISDKVVIAEN